MIVIVNKYSGGGTALKKWQQISQTLNLNNGSTETFYIGTDGSANEFILNALNNGKTDFVIAGGDGSINYFLNHIINLVEPEILKEVRIGAVGIGSSNDFHKPFSQKNLLEKVPFKLNFEGAILRDVGCLVYKKGKSFFKKYFLINASIGVTAEGNNSFNNPDFILRYLKKFNTQLAITYAAIKNILTYKNFIASVKINGIKFNASISNVGITKSPFFTGKLRYPSDPIINDSYFDVHLYQSLPKLKLLKLFYTLSKGMTDNLFNNKFWKTERINISSEKEFAVEFDGEVISTKSAEFSVIPRLLKVCTN